MKLLKYINLLLFVMILTSCNLVVNNTTTPESEALPTYIGVRILVPNGEAYYFNTHSEDGSFKMSGNVSAIGINYSSKQVTESGTMYLDLNQCYEIDVIAKDEDNEIVFPKIQTMCKNDNHQVEFKAPTNEDVTVKLDFVGVDRLLSYTIAQYDENNNKVNVKQIELNQNEYYTNDQPFSIIDTILNQQTSYFVINKKFMDDNQNTYIERKIITKDDIDKTLHQEQSENVYSLNQNNQLIIYQFTYYYEENTGGIGV